MALSNSTLSIALPFPTTPSSSFRLSPSSTSFIVKQPADHRSLRNHEIDTDPVDPVNQPTTMLSFAAAARSVLRSSAARTTVASRLASIPRIPFWAATSPLRTCQSSSIATATNSSCSSSGSVSDRKRPNQVAEGPIQPLTTIPAGSPAIARAVTPLHIDLDPLETPAVSNRRS